MRKATGSFFFFNDTATTEIYTLSLHDALPILTQKAVVIHHTLNSLGGETTVAIETIESLYELGYEVDLVTVQPPDLDTLVRSYGKKIHVDRKSTRLNSSHANISYAVFCLKKRIFISYYFLT